MSSADQMAQNNIERKVVGSALWAAAGDALGWITELASEHTVKERTGSRQVRQTLEWHRTIGGRAGVKVALPSGTYSDDTQLRLAVGRAIRARGIFDAEAFARVELTVWQSYALGAGLGTKAAAANLSKRGVNWFSNFFGAGAKQYLNGGGNGAAMRVQPHLWASVGGSIQESLVNVLKDAVITHGHPHGFGGAAFHAMSLHSALSDEPLGPARWFDYADSLPNLADMVAQDRQLSEFWLPNWEEKSQRNLRESLWELRDETLRILEKLERVIYRGSPESYVPALQQLGALEDRYRGSGIRTAIAACVLSWLYREGPVDEMLVRAANTLHSDTDTIATMAGAISGCAAVQLPEWDIQDRDYIEMEAVRLASIAKGNRIASHIYPDLARWSPPATQSDAVLNDGDSLVLAGFGPLRAVGPEHQAGDFVWQWLRSEWGQTFFAKRRSNPAQLNPREPRPESAGTRHAYGSARPIRGAPGFASEGVIDHLTSQVINANFDDRALGRAFNDCIDRLGTVEGAIAFAAIIAKARISRRRS